MKTCSFEQYKEMASLIHELEDKGNELFRSSHLHFPKCTITPLMDALDNLSNFKSLVEDRMFEEHPQLADTHIFYTQGKWI